MKRRQLPTTLIILIVVAASLFIFINNRSFDLPEGETMPLRETTEVVLQEIIEGGDEQLSEAKETRLSMREIFVTDTVKHSIPIGEIRQGCFGRDCIPSVDNPVFISRKEADDLLPEDTVGIGLVYNGETRFYPFNMLVTREIVNDELGGHPVAVTYCPLCGTGIVFDRRVGDKTFEFGVSGMLWQSNLLMYNREENEEEISLWSQVLGEGVLGVHTGTVLNIISSDVVRYTEWRKTHPNTEVLNTGRIGDPYNGDYYGVARHFRPDFDEATSPLSPTAYVFGIQMDGQFKAYPDTALEVGTTEDVFVGKDLRIEKENNGVVRIFEEGSSAPLEIVTGFWFSWVAAHPETELYK